MSPSTAPPLDATVRAGIPGSIGTRALSASSPMTVYAIASPSAEATHAPVRRASRSQPTGQKLVPSVSRAISWMLRVGVSTTRSAENCPGASPVPARPLAPIATSNPVRSVDHTAPAPRSVSSTVVIEVSWSGAATSKTRSSCVPPLLVTQYATRRPVPETAPTNPCPRSGATAVASVSRRIFAGDVSPSSAMKPRVSESSAPSRCGGGVGDRRGAAVGVAGDSPGRVTEPSARPASRTVSARTPSQKKTGRVFWLRTNRRLLARPVPSQMSSRGSTLPAARVRRDDRPPARRLDRQTAGTRVRSGRPRDDRVRGRE